MPDIEQSVNRVKAKDIIEKIRHRMVTGLEETYEVAYAPARFIVHLHPDDYDRLSGLMPRIREDAIRALKDDLKRLNESARDILSSNRLTQKLPSFLRAQFDPSMEKIEYKLSGPEWSVEMLPDQQGEFAQGEMGIESLLDVGDTGNDYSSGGKTIRVVDRYKSNGTTSQSSEVVLTKSVEVRLYARLTYKDQHGEATYRMTKPLIKVGRGGKSVPLDLVLTTPDDVSREHLHIRFNSTTQKFEIKDLSSLGTMVNERILRPSLRTDAPTGQRTDLELWEELPAAATIVLARIQAIDFEATV